MDSARLHTGLRRLSAQDAQDAHDALEAGAAARPPHRRWASRIARGTLLLALALGRQAEANAATAPYDLPSPLVSEGTPYLSGGVRDEQYDALQAIGSQWPLTLEFTLQKGSDAPLQGVRVVITTPSGRRVLDTVARGPLLLARLMPGDYLVRASLPGHTLERRFVLAPDRPVRAVFSWPDRSADQRDAQRQRQDREHR